MHVGGGPADVEPSRRTLRPLLTQDLPVRTAADVLCVVELQMLATGPLQN